MSMRSSGIREQACNPSIPDILRAAKGKGHSMRQDSDSTSKKPPYFFLAWAPGIWILKKQASLHAAPCPGHRRLSGRLHWQVSSRKGLLTGPSLTSRVWALRGTLLLGWCPEEGVWPFTQFSSLPLAVTEAISILLTAAPIFPGHCQVHLQGSFWDSEGKNTFPPSGRGSRQGSPQDSGYWVRL